MDWFLYDNGVRHERVNGETSLWKITAKIYENWLFDFQDF